MALNRFSRWMWGGKEKKPISNGSSLNPSSDYVVVEYEETDSVNFTSKNFASNREVKRKWHSRGERRIEKQCGDAVLIQSDDGVFFPESESDGPDWSIGWEDDGFAVLVPCYRSGCKELVERSNNQLLNAIKNLPSQLSSEGKNCMELLMSLQNV